MDPVDQKPLNIIETLARGFEIILQNPWIVLLPILLDLFVWLGPQISAKPLFDQLIAELTANAPTPTDTPSEAMQNFDVFKSALQSTGDASNVFGIVTTGLPTLFWIIAPATEWARPLALSVDNVATLGAVLIPLTLIGVFFTALYFDAIARVVRHDAPIKNFAVRIAQGFSATLSLLVVLILAVIGFMIPVSFGTLALSLVSQGLASFAILLASLMLLWATIYLAFALASIFVSRSNAVQAIFNSISLFRFDFWSSMGLIVLIYLIRWGFALVWQLFLDNPWGILFDVIANAFLGSGLTAAMLVYYADRMMWLNRLRERVRQHLQTKG
jgi:hypothetical protein